MASESLGRSSIEVLPPEYEPGKPAGEGVGRWAHKLATRKDILSYLKSAEGYTVRGPSSSQRSSSRA